MNRNLLTIICTFFSAVVLAQPTGWTYSMPISVTENSGSSLYNYQVRIVLNTQSLISAGQMNATGSDMRFGKDCAGTMLYSHWIESGINTSSTVVWVKVDTLLASSTRTIYMFHGNSSASSSSTLSVFSGPHSATDSVSGGTNGGVGNSQRGFRFAPTQDILMTHFGKNEPTGTTRYVTLFNYTTQAVVEQIQVSGPASGYSYGTVNNPTWLTSGTQYILTLFQGPSDGYYYGTSSQAGQHITYYDMRYCNSCTQNTFPTDVLSNYHYGYPDMLYYTRQNASVAPTVTVNSGTFAVTASSSSSTVCAGSSVSLSASPSGGTSPYSYQWSPSSSLSSSTVSNPTASPASTTTYTVSVTDGVGCMVTSTVTITTSPLPSVNLGSDITACSGDVIMLDAANPGATYSWSTAATTQMINVTTAGTYSVMVTDVNTCSNSDTISVAFNAPPVVSLGSDVIQCGGSVTLDAGNAGASYQWQDASTSQMFTANASGTYYVAVTDPNTGCEGSDTVNVTIHANPVVTLMMSNDSACTDWPAFTLTGGSPAGGSYSGTGVSAGMFDPNMAGAGAHTITYTVVDSNGCTGSSAANIYVDLCTGISQPGNSPVSIYPNPSTGSIMLNFVANGNVRLFIISPDGRRVIERNMSDLNGMQQLTLDLSEYAKGIYLISLQTGNETITSKLIIQ
jgi:hypothetical protein